MGKTYVPESLLIPTGSQKNISGDTVTEPTPCKGCLSQAYGVSSLPLAACPVKEHLTPPTPSWGYVVIRLYACLRGGRERKSMRF